jgi:hypothetical protein
MTKRGILPPEPSVSLILTCHIRIDLLADIKLKSRDPQACNARVTVSLKEH